MAEWQEHKLGDVLTFQRGHDLPREQMLAGKYPVAGSSGIIGYHSAFTTEGPGVTIGRSGTIGTPHFYHSDYWAHNTVLYVKDFKRSFPKFIYYFLKSFDFSQFNAGSAVPTLNRNHIHDLIVLIPPEEEQRAIASILSSLDDKLDLLHRQNKTLEDLAQTLFRQWFVKEAEEGWKKTKLGEFVEIKHGYAFSGAYIVADETDKILVTPGNFKIGGGFSFEKFKYYNADDFPGSFAFDEGDFIVTMTDLSQDTDTLGYPAFVPTIAGKRLLHNQRVGKVVFRKDHSDKRHFIYNLMRSEVYRHYIIGRSTGMAVRHTSPSSICDFEFALPDSSIINSFEKQIEPHRQRERLNQLEIQTLTQLRDTLLPKLMSGEVRVAK